MTKKEFYAIVNTHSSVITATKFAIVKEITDNRRELYILLDKGCSTSILSDNYLNYFKNIKSSKFHYNTEGQYSKLLKWSLIF